MKAIAQVLYREVKGAGDDEEASGHADGVVVTLSMWQICGTDWRIRSHYLMETAVMIDREITVRSFTVETLGATEAEMIRSAIKTFDDLVAVHPAFGMGEQS